MSKFKDLHITFFPLLLKFQVSTSRPKKIKLPGSFTYEIKTFLQWTQIFRIFADGQKCKYFWFPQRPAQRLFFNPELRKYIGIRDLVFVKQRIIVHFCGVGSVP